MLHPCFSRSKKTRRRRGGKAKADAVETTAAIEEVKTEEAPNPEAKSEDKKQDKDN